MEFGLKTHQNPYFLVISDLTPFDHCVPNNKVYGQDFF